MSDNEEGLDAGELDEELDELDGEFDDEAAEADTAAGADPTDEEQPADAAADGAAGAVETDDAAEAADAGPTEVETGADAVVRALENAGVEHLFGVQGGAIMPVYDALYHSEMDHVTMAHEQGAAHAADA